MLKFVKEIRTRVDEEDNREVYTPEVSNEENVEEDLSGFVQENPGREDIGVENREDDPLLNTEMFEVNQDNHEGGEWRARRPNRGA